MNLKKFAILLFFTASLITGVVPTASAVTTTAMGIIWDATNNTPCSFAWVWIYSDSNSVYANANGVYIIENFDLADFWSNTYLGATRTGYADIERYKPIEPGKVNTINARIYIGSLVQGVIRANTTGSPTVGGVTVTAQGDDLYARTLSAPDGTYQMRLEPGEYDLYLQKAGYAPSLKMIYEFYDLVDYPNTDFSLYLGGNIKGTAYYGDTTATVSGLDINYEHAEGRSWPNGSATTAADGSYIINNVYPEAVDMWTNNDGQWWYKVERKNVPVIDQQTTTNIDFRLIPAGALCGTITAYSGVPVTDADVVSISRSNGDDNRDWVDGDGFYAIQPLPEGQYDITVEPQQGNNYQIQKVGNVTVTHMGTTFQNFTLQPGAILEGYVHGINGNTVTGADISIYNEHQYPFEEAISGSSIKTDANGFYSVDGLSPQQEYVVDVNPQDANTFNANAVARHLTFQQNQNYSRNFVLGTGGSQTGTIYAQSGQPFEGYFYLYCANLNQAVPRVSTVNPYTLHGWPEGNYLQMIFFIELSSQLFILGDSYGSMTAGQTQTVNYTAPAYGAIRGNVYYEVSPGNTVTASDVKMLIKDYRSIYSQFNFGGDILCDQTDAGGYYKIDGVTSGTYEVIALAPREDVDGYASDHYQLNFNAAASVNLNFILRHNGVCISGSVRDQVGTGVGESMVCFWNSSHQRFVAETDDLGNYAIMLKPGTYSYQGHYRSSFGGNFSMDPEKLTVVAGQNQYRDVMLELGGTITGTITDQKGNALQLAKIVVPDPGQNVPDRMGVCNRDGTYAITGLNTGNYTVTAAAAGYSSASKPVSVTLGEETENVNVVLVAQTSIAGTVKARDGRMVKEGKVMLLDSNGQTTMIATPDSGGNFILAPLSGGPHTVKATALGMKSAVTNDLYAGDRADFTLSPLIGKDEAISYPNPCRGGQITFLYWLDEDSTVLIRVYNQTAELVWDWEGAGTGSQFNRHVWQVSGVAPGVYLYKVTARNNQGSVHSFNAGKLTVIK